MFSTFTFFEKNDLTCKICIFVFKKIPTKSEVIYIVTVKVTKNS